MLTLYDYLPSQNGWKIRLLLNQLNQTYQQKFVSIFEGEGRTRDYLAINPTGAVPALQLEDGSTIAESNAILVYLAYDTTFYPSDPLKQAKVLQWLFFESDYVQASVATLRHWKLTGKDAKRSSDMMSNKHNASIKTISVLDSWLSEKTFLIGNDYTIADISVFAYVHLCEDAGVMLNDYPNVRRWIETVRNQPRFLDEVFPYSMDKYSIREL